MSCPRSLASSDMFFGFANDLICWLYLPQMASAFDAYSSLVRGVPLFPPPHAGEQHDERKCKQRQSTHSHYGIDRV